METVAQVIVTPVMIAELKLGFLGGDRQKSNERRLADFIARPSVKLVGLDHETAEYYAEIQNYLRHTGSPVPSNDVWIAACAMQHGCRVLTTDEHFRRIPQVMTEYVPVRVQE